MTFLTWRLPPPLHVSAPSGQVATLVEGGETPLRAGDLPNSPQALQSAPGIPGHHTAMFQPVRDIPVLEGLPSRGGWGSRNSTSVQTPKPSTLYRI